MEAIEAEENQGKFFLSPLKKSLRSIESGIGHRKSEVTKNNSIKILHKSQILKYSHFQSILMF